MGSRVDILIMRAESGDPQAVAELKRDPVQRIINDETQAVVKYKQFRMVDPGRISLVVSDRLMLEIDRPTSPFWKAVRRGRQQWNSAEEGIRKLVRRRLVSAALDDRESMAAPITQDPAAEVFDSAYETAVFIQFLSVLTPDERQGVYCWKVESWPITKVASVRGQPESTVRDWLNRAIEKVRRAAGGFFD